MSGKLSYERYHWFDGQIRAARYPNATTLSQRYEISVKQAQRDIEFIRDRLEAPLRFNRKRNGYAYENGGYELPPIWFTGEEILAFCLALRLSAAIPDREFKNALHAFLGKSLALRSLDPSPTAAEIEEKVSVKNVEYYRVGENIFHTAVGALFGNQSLRIIYHSPHKDEMTERLIVPLHLLFYMGSWHLIAFCSLRGGLRDFALSRVRAIAFADEKIALPDNLPPIKEYVRKNFGVITGEGSIEVTLRFTPALSPWVSEQIWHDLQEISQNPDGSLHLKFPVSGFKEVIREILKYGASVEVISPEELRRAVEAEIKKMGEIYVRKVNPISLDIR